MTGRAVSREEAAGTACQGWGRAALCPPSLTAPLQGHPGTPILGQAMSMLTPHHCPLAALPGPRWRVAPSPHILICGPGWHLPWPPRDLVPAGQPPGGDPPLHQGGPQCRVCLQKLLGWAQDVSWACKPPSPLRLCVQPPLSKQAGASLHTAHSSRGAHPSLLDVPHGDPSVDGSRVPGPACPGSLSLPGLPSTPRILATQRVEGTGVKSPGCRFSALGRRKAPPTPRSPL